MLIFCGLYEKPLLRVYFGCFGMVVISMEAVLSLTALRCREVIRVCDGKSLGCVSDLLFDRCTGCVTALCVLADDGKLFSFGGQAEIVIPWEKIRCIGEDVILVNMDPQECSCAVREKPRRKKDCDKCR